MDGIDEELYIIRYVLTSPLFGAHGTSKTTGRTDQFSGSMFACRSGGPGGTENGTEQRPVSSGWYEGIRWKNVIAME